MRAPQLDPGCAGVVLALVAAARAHAPEAPLAWLCGYAARASGEPICKPARVHDPRAEPGDSDQADHGVTVARVALTRNRG